MGKIAKKIQNYFNRGAKGQKDRPHGSKKTDEQFIQEVRRASDQAIKDYRKTLIYLGDK